MYCKPRFPLRKPKILKKWLDNMGIKNWIPNNSSLLCSEHFKESCFQKKGKKLLLKERSVPTIFKTECLNDIKSGKIFTSFMNFFLVITIVKLYFFSCVDINKTFHR